MTEPKYPIGTRVEILSRRGPGRENVWENTYVGNEAVVISIEDWGRGGFNDVDADAPGYNLLIFFNNKSAPYSCSTYEERFLELVCCNTDKGKALLEKHKNEL